MRTELAALIGAMQFQAQLLMFESTLGEAINGVGVFQVAWQLAENIKNIEPFQGKKKKSIQLMRFVAFKEFEMCQHNACFDAA